MKHLYLIAVLVAAAPSQAAETIRPGQWQMVNKTKSFSMPGMPAGLAQKMGGGMTLSRCITPEQVKDNPRSLFEGTQGKCSSTKFNMSGGKIDSVAVCEQPGGKTTISGSGTYTPTSYEMDMTMTANGKQGGMTIKTHVTGKRIGDCSK
jgi:hypothetical protein